MVPRADVRYKGDSVIRGTVLIQKIQLYAYVAGQDALAAATGHRYNEQMILVDEPGPNRVCGEVRTSHRNRLQIDTVASILTVAYRTPPVRGQDRVHLI